MLDNRIKLRLGSTFICGLTSSGLCVRMWEMLIEEEMLMSGKRVKHTLEVHDADCEIMYCNVCEGGLANCVVCGGAESSLTSECCGYRIPPGISDQVSMGTLDYEGGIWFRPTKMLPEMTTIKMQMGVLSARWRDVYVVAKTMPELLEAFEAERSRIYGK